MTLSLGTNIASLTAQRAANEATERLTTSFERLSSGLRINSAKDDPAGLAVADDLRADARLASVAIRNANDGLSLAAIAGAAMGEISNILIRMSELAEQSANSVLTNDQRSSLQIEFDQLGSEIQRIADVTEFNGINLIDDNSQDIEIQVGIDGSSDSQVSVDGVSGSLFSVNLTGAAGSTALTHSLLSVNYETEAGAAAASLEALTAIRNALNSIDTRRGILGASESRLTYAVNYIAIARENFIAAESRIRDVDVAQEVANLVQAQIVQQGAIAMLAQANQQAGVVLGLVQF